MARKLIAISANVFFPTTILNIISFSTNYYKNDYFESIVGINLTSMLVLTALIVQVLSTDICKKNATLNVAYQYFARFFIGPESDHCLPLSLTH